jgi:hypothetical protein
MDRKQEIWNRAIRPQLAGLSPEAAHGLLQVGLSDADRLRVSELSAKANAGSLSKDEAEELEQYLDIGSALEILKAKARLSLKSAA